MPRLSGVGMRTADHAAGQMIEDHAFAGVCAAGDGDDQKRVVLNLRQELLKQSARPSGAGGVRQT